MARAVIRAEALAAYLRSPDGDVGRMMISLAERVKQLAVRQVGYDERKPSGQEGGRHLKDTIVKRVIDTPAGIVVLVGSADPIALLHHEGTRPHEIRPKREGGVLAFEIEGQVVFAAVVHHPGTKPNHYLTDPLETVMRAVA